MKKESIYFLLSYITIFISTPLGYKVLTIVYSHKNLSAEEFFILLIGFIGSFVLIGILFFIRGVIEILC